MIRTIAARECIQTFVWSVAVEATIEAIVIAWPTKVPPDGEEFVGDRPGLSGSLTKRYAA